MDRNRKAEEPGWLKHGFVPKDSRAVGWGGVWRAGRPGRQRLPGATSANLRRLERREESGCRATACEDKESLSLNIPSKSQFALLTDQIHSPRRSKFKSSVEWD